MLLICACLLCCAVLCWVSPQVLYEESKGEAIITTGVGQHQMFAAQWYPLCEPRRWVSSGGLGSMGFGLPSALGAAAAHDGKKGRPSRVVVDIDGDGSFLMNCQELATAAIEKLNCKVGRVEDGVVSGAAGLHVRAVAWLEGAEM